ncbi:response regulator transcription factor [Natronoglycomyces albus]|uniref:Response regulator transcription factor n=1 Tax=Natronoglycomyces albus TaxID=2811108 RepID=A0A895XTT2_9ACTN|nr:response regulator transcription factor [Natronoglycomyces albus]QSB06709.1 response regulator transcription factor [Natronoglycomyces albus]
MITLLVADDEALIRGALVALLDLEEDLSVIAQVDNSVDAVTQAAQLRPDVAVLDLEMPPADGLVAAEEIRAQAQAQGANTKIILVTRHARPGVLRRALSCGVSAFVPKTTPSLKLAQIIRDVYGGQRYVDPDIAASALTEGSCPLTDRELDVLRAARAGGSVKDIASEVHLAQGTVRNYLSSAMMKLNARSRYAAAQHAWEQGWI